MTGPAGPSNRNDPGTRGGVPWWWWIIGYMCFWSALALWPANQSQVEVPYSTFIAQVQSGNVAKIQVTGDAITGTFKKPYAAHTAFRTGVPTALGTSLQRLLEGKQVEVDVSPTAAPSLATSLLGWLPLLLLAGAVIWMVNRAAGRMGGIAGFGNVKTVGRREQESSVTFNDVAGAAEAKSELEEEVDFLRHPEKYHALGARIPRGILLIGPPGTGKTLLARAVAGEAKVPFFSLNASEFVEMFVGVGASRVRDLFRKAKEAAPAIVFIDELDAVGRRRGAGVGTVNDEREQTLNQLLGELDGFDQRAEVIILAATNRPDVLDPALLRPGRFDRQVVVALPDADDRLRILQLHAKKLKLAPDVDLRVIARTTTGLSGADLENLCNEAALAAAHHNHLAVMPSDFEEASDRIRLGSAHHRLVDPSERRIVAYHESGHAVTAWFTPGADPVQKVTIIPRGQALGMTEQIPEIERRNLSRAYLQARLVVMLGGRAAEELALGKITTGAESDLVEATKLARRMVTRWGMGDLGLVAFKVDEEQPFLGYEIAQGREYGDATADIVDRNVRMLLDGARDEARARLADHRDALDRLAGELLESETIGPDALQRLLGSNAAPDDHAVGASR
ncbi:MAG TPA: ATP-dependent zinc metalloprotease FtsH [Candidatus Acidoferrales bacterium]|nr:ATP-dependent zinc metalloprotease FtsH [Candidatus Acidoferrales bacterium]